MLILFLFCGSMNYYVNNNTLFTNIYTFIAQFVKPFKSLLHVKVPAQETAKSLILIDLCQCKVKRILKKCNFTNAGI